MGFVLLIWLLFLPVLKLLSVIKMLHHYYSNNGRSRNTFKTCLCCKTFQDDVQGPPSLPLGGTPWPQYDHRSHSTVLLALRNGQKEINSVFTSNVLKERQDGSRDGRRDLCCPCSNSIFMCSCWKASRIGSLSVFLTLDATLRTRGEISSWELCNQRAGFDWYRHGRKLLQEAHFRFCATGGEETELWA